MRTECSASEIDFGRAGGRRIVADFDGGMAFTDAGVLLLGETDKAISLVESFSACFRDERNPIYVVHEIETLVAQRVFGLALGYEDLLDHDELRRDPVFGVLLGKLDRALDEPAPARLMHIACFGFFTFFRVLLSSSPRLNSCMTRSTVSFCSGDGCLGMSDFRFPDILETEHVGRARDPSG